MLAMQYIHRLPADYDMERIRLRAVTRGPVWDGTPGLAFKGFVARERGRFGAIGNVYSSVYLWLDPARAADFIMDDRFRNVVDSFGRPRIETWLPFDVRTGRAAHAHTLYREDVALADAVDHAVLRSQEAERNAVVADEADTVAVVSALDLSAWRLIRLTLSAAAPDAARAGDAFQVLYLARPEFDSLR